MGKFATYAKRGSAAEYGSMVAPIASDWTFTAPSAGNYSFNRLVSIPAPATKWGGRLHIAGNAWILTGAIAATPIANTAPAGTYQGQVAWFDTAGYQLSPWSDVKTIVVT